MRTVVLFCELKSGKWKLVEMERKCLDGFIPRIRWGFPFHIPISTGFTRAYLTGLWTAEFTPFCFKLTT